MSRTSRKRQQKMPSKTGHQAPYIIHRLFQSFGVFVFVGSTSGRQFSFLQGHTHPPFNTISGGSKEDKPTQIKCTAISIQMTYKFYCCTLLFKLAIRLLKISHSKSSGGISIVPDVVFGCKRSDGGISKLQL